MRLGPTVRALRKRKGWSLCELARQAGVTKSHLSYVENGKRTMSIPLAEKVATALGMKLSSLIRKCEQP